jgi:hypothetical protein
VGDGRVVHKVDLSIVPTPEDASFLLARSFRNAWRLRQFLKGKEIATIGALEALPPDSWAPLSVLSEATGIPPQRLEDQLREASGRVASRFRRIGPHTDLLEYAVDDFLMWLRGKRRFRSAIRSFGRHVVKDHHSDVPAGAHAGPSSDLARNERGEPIGDVVSLEEAANLVGVSITLLHRWIATGKLTAYGVARMVRVEDVQKLASEEHVPAETPTSSSSPRVDEPRSSTGSLMDVGPIA